MNQDLFAVLLILVSPSLFAVAALVGASPRHGGPRVFRVLLGVYVVMGIVLPLVLGWVYFRPEFWSVVGLLAVYNVPICASVLQDRRQAAKASRDADQNAQG